MPQSSFNVFTRTAAKAQPLVEEFGERVTIVDSPAAAAQDARVVFSIVGYPQDVKQVYLDDTNGVLNTLAPGSICVDMTTSAPALAAEIAGLAQAKNISVFDGPVSGGDIGARNGQLTVFLGGGNADTLKELNPILDCFSKKVTHFGFDAGRGQSAKLVNQLAICSTMVSVCESMVFAAKAGLPLEDTLAAISGGAAASFSLTAYMPRIFKGDMEPGFFVEHFIKDLQLCLDEAKRMDLKLPGLELAHRLYCRLRDEFDGGKQGTQALIRVLEAENGVSVRVAQAQ